MWRFTNRQATIYIAHISTRNSKIWNVARISGLKVKSTESGLRVGKIRGIIYSTTKSHSEFGARLRFNRFRSFSLKCVTYFPTIECTHSRKRERYEVQIAPGWSRRRQPLSVAVFPSTGNISLIYVHAKKAISLFYFTCNFLFLRYTYHAIVCFVRVNIETK